MNLAFLGGRRDTVPRLHIVMGALTPDIPIFLFYFYQKLITGASEHDIWSEVYFRPEWQMVFDTFHSIPIALVGLLVARRIGSTGWQAFFASLCLHSLIDLPLHNDDAHRHFFPLSDYMFMSPISYWDPRHYGFAATFAETVTVMIASFVVWRGLKLRLGKALLVMVNLLYILGVVLYFIYMEGM